jgi:hypothetical protein
MAHKIRNSLYILLVYNFEYYKSYSPYKESRPRDLGRSREQMRKIYVKLFFSLLCSFILSVVTPLHFAHLYNLIPHDTSQCIKNLDGVLSISQIILNTKVL